MAPRSLLDFVHTACDYDPTEDLIPFIADSVLAGWLKPAFAERLRDWPEVFLVRPRGVSLSGDFADAQHRTAVLADVVETLATEGVITGWRNELVSVSETFHSAPIFDIERAASRHFGIMSYASHLNGCVTRDGVPMIWIARRSPTKPIDPELLDNLVGGRIARGMTPLATLHKECAEEAGIPESLACLARPAGVVNVCRKVDEGVHRELVFVHDLDLPADFVPRNQDGEVAEFLCVDIPGAIAHVERMATHGEFAADAALVLLDHLIRRGHVDASRADYVDIIRALKP